MTLANKQTDPDADSPPPSYTPVADVAQLGDSEHPHAFTSAPQAPLPHNHIQAHPQAYGPTPIPHAVSQGGLLPYYDPQSEYARRQAVSRARWRFVEAFVWGVGIWVLVGIVTGGIVVDVHRHSRRV